MNRDNDRQTSIILYPLPDRYPTCCVAWTSHCTVCERRLAGDTAELDECDERPISYRALRGQCKNCPRFASLLWNGHRDLLLYTQELPTPGGTRQRKMGQCQSRGQEIPAEPTVRKQADDAGSPYRTQRQETPPQSEHPCLRRFRCR